MASSDDSSPSDNALKRALEIALRDAGPGNFERAAERLRELAAADPQLAWDLDEALAQVLAQELSAEQYARDEPPC